MNNTESKCNVLFDIKVSSIDLKHIRFKPALCCSWQHLRNPHLNIHMVQSHYMVKQKKTSAFQLQGVNSQLSGFKMSQSLAKTSDHTFSLPSFLPSYFTVKLGLKDQRKGKQASFEVSALSRCLSAATLVFVCPEEPLEDKELQISSHDYDNALEDRPSVHIVGLGLKQEVISPSAHTCYIIEAPHVLDSKAHLI